MEELKRVFISLEIPEDIKQKIGNLTGIVGEIYPHPLDNFHITLKFVGEVDEEQEQLLESLIEFLGSQYAPIAIAFEELKVVESRMRLVAKNLAKMQELFDSTILNLKKIGLYAEDEIAFEPHVTLGKVRAGSEPPLVLYDFSKLNFTADALVLYQTTKGEKAAIYVPLKKIPLSGAEM